MAINETLLKAYVHYRRSPYTKRPVGAVDAIRFARADVAANKPQYGSTQFYPLYAGAFYNPKLDKPVSGKYVRWVENAGDVMRLVGFADEICRSEHSRAVENQGWFIDDFQSEVYRGIVYQLPARGGNPQFVYGYADPNNEGCALLCFDLDADDKLDAARSADHFAETWAAQEREYQEAWRARQRYNDLGEEISEARKATIELIAGLRPVKRHLTQQGVVMEAVRGKVRDLLEAICDARKARRDLIDSYGREAAWKDG